MLLLHAEALIRVQVVHAVVLLTRVLAVVLLPVLLLTLREAEGQVLEVVLLIPVAVRQLLHAVILMKVPLVVRTTVLLLVVARLRAVILHHPVAVHVVILLVAAVVLPVLPVEVAALQEVEDNNGDINFKRHLTMKK